jgi:alkylation response protein AidB-like acyl-CoA dehydrogenase
MNFLLTEEQQALKDLAARAGKQILAPIIEQDEKTGTFRPELVAELGKLGLSGIPVPVEYEGSGLGYLDYTIAMEEISVYGISYAISLAVSGLPQIILNLFGNEEQKKKYIPHTFFLMILVLKKLMSPGWM